MTVKNVSLTPKNEDGATAGKKTNNKKRAFVHWVKKIRQQYILSGLQSELGDIIGNTRYVCLLENGDAESIRIDSLEKMMRMVGFDFQKQNEFYEKAKSLAESIEPVSSMTFIDLLKKRYEIIDGQFDESLFKNGVSDKKKAEFKNYIFQLPHLGKDYEYGNNKLIDMQTLHYFWAVVVVEWFVMQKHEQDYNIIMNVWDRIEKLYAAIKKDEEEIMRFRDKIAHIKDGIVLSNAENDMALQRVMNIYLMISLQSIKLLAEALEAIQGIGVGNKEIQPAIQVLIQQMEACVDSFNKRGEMYNKNKEGNLYWLSKLLFILEKQSPDTF